MKNVTTKSELKRAALRSFVMWSWLSRQGRLSRKEWPFSIKIMYPLFLELGYHKDSYYCPWCSLFAETCNLVGKRKKRMQHCPLSDHFNKGSCCYPNSLYGQFVLADSTKESQRVAGDIANIAWREYKRLGG